jgi:hypothetical protein
MKKQLALLSLIAAALIATPAVINAQENTTPTPPPAKKHEKHGATPFHGKVSAVDAKASTLSIGQMTINVTSDTKITKDGKPATLADIAVGDKVSGNYKKDEAGKMSAVSLHVGDKGDKKKSEKPEKN